MLGNVFLLDILVKQFDDLECGLAVELAGRAAVEQFRVVGGVALALECGGGGGVFKAL